MSLSENKQETAIHEACISVCIVCRNEADKLAPCLESVEWADEILVMDQGRVVDRGTLPDLLNRSELMRSLWAEEADAA